MCTERETDEGKVYKARLVVRGFEDDDFGTRKDSPTCGKGHLRTVMAVAASHQWKVQSLDIKAAFLQGNKIERDVYLKPPVEANTTKLWKLDICVYGLGEASRLWYIRLKKELHDLGLTESKYDGAIFYYQDGSLLGIIAVHVDDVLWAGTPWFEINIIENLKKIFLISKQCRDNFIYVGLSLIQEDDKIEVHQDHYIKDTKLINIDKDGTNRGQHSAINNTERKQLRSTIGMLNWIATQTRPDISFDVCQASVSFKDATVKDLKKVNKVVCRLHNDHVSIKYENIGDLSRCKLVTFSDASYGNLADGGSQGGHIIFICNNSNKVIPLQWQSKRIRRIARSTMAAECLAMVDAVDAAFLIKSLLEELLLCQNSIKIVSIIDNKSLFDALYSTKTIEDKRLSVDVAAVREKLNNGEIAEVKWVESSKQIADCLTKSGASAERLIAILKKGEIE